MGLPDTRGVGFAFSKGRGLTLPVRLLLWLAGFGVVLSIFLGWNSSVVNDFTQNVWLPARLVLDGADPYYPTPGQVDAALGEHRAQFGSFNSGSEYHFIYPIWMALLFTPLAALPLTVAMAVWRALNLLVLVWGVGAVLRSTNPAFRAWQAPAITALGLTLLLSVVYRESLLTIIIGQFSILAFGLLAAIWSRSISPAGLTGRAGMANDLLIGVALALLATKPQAMGLPVLLLGLWGISRGRWTIPVSAGGTLAILLLAPLALFPGSLLDWLKVVFGGQATSQLRHSASVWGLSYQWLGAQVGLWVAAALTLFGLAALAFVWRRDLADRVSVVPLSLPLTICVNVVISPYMLGYEHVLLLLPALALLAAAGLPGEAESAKDAANRKLWRVALYTWLGIIPWLVLLVQAGIAGAYPTFEHPALAQSASMLALCWVGYRFLVNHVSRLTFHSEGVVKVGIHA